MSKYLKVQLLVLFCILTVLTLFSLYTNPGTRKLFGIPTASVKNQENLFSSLNNDANEKGSYMDVLFRKYGGDLVNRKNGAAIYGIGTSLLQIAPDVEWDIENTPFWADVNEKTNSGTLKITFINPRSMPYLNKQQEVTPIGCDLDNSFITIEDLHASGRLNSDFLSSISDGDQIISYCLNQECSTIGNLCKIYRKNYEH